MKNNFYTTRIIEILIYLNSRVNFLHNFSLICIRGMMNKLKLILDCLYSDPDRDDTWLGTETAKEIE